MRFQACIRHKQSANSCPSLWGCKQIQFFPHQLTKCRCTSKNSHIIGRTKLLHASLAAGLFFSLGACSGASRLPSGALQELRQQVQRRTDIIPAKRLSPQHENLPIALKDLGSDYGVKLVRIRVHQFYNGFFNGARDSNHHLELMQAKYPSLVNVWLNTSKEKRVFIIGSGDDLEMANQWSRELQNKGYRTFFFRDCNPASCTDAEVGAMLATAGIAFYLNTPSARQSRFVEVEIAAARQLQGHQEEGPVLIPAVEILESIRAKSESQLASRSDDYLCESSYLREESLLRNRCEVQ